MALPAQCKLMDSEDKEAFALSASSSAALNTAQEPPPLVQPDWTQKSSCRRKVTTAPKKSEISPENGTPAA